MHGQLAEANAFPVAVGEKRIVHSGKAHAKKLRALSLPPNSLPLRIVRPQRNARTLSVSACVSSSMSPQLALVFVTAQTRLSSGKTR
jgi:hypothetical protein